MRYNWKATVKYGMNNWHLHWWMFCFPLGSLQIDKSRRRENLCLRVAQLQIFAHTHTKKKPTKWSKKDARCDTKQARFSPGVMSLQDRWWMDRELQTVKCPETCSIIVLSWLAKDEKLNLSILFFKCWAFFFFFTLNIVIYDISYVMYTFLNSHAGLKVYIDILIMTCVPTPSSSPPFV